MFSLVIFSIIISALNAFIYIKLIKCLLFDKMLLKKKIINKDFFLFNSEHFRLNSVVLSLIIFLISLMICILPLFLNDVLIIINSFSDNSFLILSEKINSV